MTKKIIKCSSCKNVFFTNKKILTKSEFQDQAEPLYNEIKEFLKDLKTNESLLLKTKKQIKITKNTINDIKRDIMNLNTKVQCSNCGTRINAIDNEVNT